MSMDLKYIHSIFFLGIGGIGMSALARYFHARGVKVSGYDKTCTQLTRKLQQQGMQIGYQDDPAILPQNCQLVIYTPAIPVSTNLFKAIEQNGIPLLKRAKVLGMISAEIPTIAIAGTHGKTTISTMVAHIMHSAGIPFSAFLGGISANYQTNFLGTENPQWMVVEADEFDRSFLHLTPNIAVISSMDPDHLDIYGSAESMVETFSLFANRIDTSGTLILKQGLNLPGGFKGKTIGYHHGLTADLCASNIRVLKGSYTASVKGLMEIEDLQLGLPGKHNLENALAAIAVAHTLGISKEVIQAALKSFRGVKRRFEIILQDEQMVYIDDYAHHPEELRACISAARELFPGRKITGIFQPHLFSRTRDLAQGFAESLALLDELLLMDIYPARETPIEGITSGWLLENIPMNQKRMVSKEEIPGLMAQQRPEVLLTMGAGDIDLLVEPIKIVLQQKTIK